VDFPGQGWQARRVTKRLLPGDAQRGIEEEYHTYPPFFSTREQAIAFCADRYAHDGPGDPGGNAELRTWIAEHPAGQPMAGAGMS
jgi:hypothetical protein